jgi:hypothetical protein
MSIPLEIATQTVSEPEFFISNLSLPKPLPYFGTINQHAAYIDEIQADGEELTPFNGSVLMKELVYRGEMIQKTERLKEKLSQHCQDMELMSEGFDPKKDWTAFDTLAKGLVRAGHLSFRGNVDDNGILARTVPKWGHSLTQLSIIRHLVDRLPVVFYPAYQAGLSYESRSFSARTFQPKATEWQQMDLTEDSSIADITIAINERGYTGLTFDVFHSQGSKNNLSFKDPVNFAGRLAAAGLVTSAHLALNRTDITGFRGSAAAATRRARSAFVCSPQAAALTVEGEMLSAIAQGMRSLPPESKLFIVLEDGPFRVARHTKYDHTAILAHARELVAAA